MKPQLFAHPFSSYCQKVLIALYENGTAFDYPHARARSRPALSPNGSRSGRSSVFRC